MTTRLSLCAILFSPLCAAAAPESQLQQARDLLRNGKIAESAKLLDEMAQANPADPWTRYNEGVAAYAAGDYRKADQIWEELAGTPLPPDLNGHVWTQIGNVSFRLAQKDVDLQPDVAISGLEQSREAYRVVLSQEKHNKLASTNLAVVEKELARLYAMLSRKLVEQAAKESQPERAIEKLESALEYTESAKAAAPNDPEHQQQEKKIEQMLAQKFTEKASKTESEADKADLTNDWQRQNAREQLEHALADFQQASSYDPQNQPAKEGEQRVTQKLAHVLDQEARKEQRQAENEHWAPAALDHFETALQDFQQALALQPAQSDAQKGEQEVKQEMEKIHLDQGDQQQQQAENEAKQNAEDAAGKMLSALEHFEQARDLNPESKPIQDRIDRVEKELPDLLMAMARREQQQGEQAEQHSPDGAVAHLERAETALDKTEQLAPQNQEAQQRMAQVQSDLSRLRQQLAEQAAQQAQNRGEKPSEQPNQDFAKLAQNVKTLQEQRQVNMHHQPPRPYDPKDLAVGKKW